METKKKKISTSMISKIAMLSAVAAILMYIEFPIPIVPEFYKLDFSEIPVLIGSFAMGPVAGVIIEFVKIFIKFLIKGSTTGGVGEIANFIIGCSFCIPAAIVYKVKHTKKGAILGLVIGTIAMIAIGCIVNGYILLPVYAKVFGMPIDAIVALGTAVNSKITSLATFVMLGVAPFNLIKGVVISVITILIYKKISPILHK